MLRVYNTNKLIHQINATAQSEVLTNGVMRRVYLRNICDLDGCHVTYHVTQSVPRLRVPELPELLQRSLLGGAQNDDEHQPIPASSPNALQLLRSHFLTTLTNRPHTPN